MLQPLQSTRSKQKQCYALNTPCKMRQELLHLPGRSVRDVFPSALPLPLKHSPHYSSCSTAGGAGQQ